MGSLYGFIAERKSRWARFEELLAALERERSLDAARLLEFDSLYREINTDLALAQNRYPDGDYVKLLRSLLLRAHNLIYPSKKELGASASEFARRTLPAAVVHHKKLILAALAIFSLGLATGAAVSMRRPEIGEIFLGADRIAGLRRGELWTSHLQESGLWAYFAIFGNNAAVALRTLASGVLAGLGGFVVLLYNGFQLGAIAAACGRYNMLGDILEFISSHGFLEIFCVLMAGAAGINLGLALFAPGRLTRKTALAKAGAQSAPILIVLIPLLAAAGAIETFISPSPHIPTAFKFVFGPLMLGLFLFYVYSASRDNGGKESGRKVIPTLE